MNELRAEAIFASAEMLTGLKSENFWAGEPWVLWVTDQPNGHGNMVLSLTFSATTTERPGLIIDVVLPKNSTKNRSLGLNTDARTGK